MRPPREILDARYRVLSLIGQGGMGSVWRGEQLSLGTPVAIKLLDPRLAESDSQRARFLREARAAAALRSPHVVQIIDHGVEEDTPFIVMELLEGESLRTRLRRPPKLALEEIAEIFSGVGRAMARAHQAGIVHRDLKPDNVFLARDGGAEPLVKVLDFGIAKLIDATAPTDEVQTQTGAVLGTPHYMSPEQTRGRKALDGRSDLWSMAVIAYECVVGRRPFQADVAGELVMLICSEPLPVPSEHGAVPPGFDAWFARGVERDPEKRFQTVQELVGALEDVLAPSRRTFDSGPRTADDDAERRAIRVSVSVEEGKATPSMVNAATVRMEPASRRVWGLVGLTVAALVVGLGVWALREPASAAPPDAIATTPSGSALPPAPWPPPDDDASRHMRDELSQLGWMMQGMAPDGFAVRLDPAERRDGHPALTLVPVGAQEGQYGTWVRVVSAREYAGHRIRVSGFTKTDGATARAELWARVQAKDSAGDGAGLGGHWEHLPAASEWTRREIVLEVPEEASVINYGVGRTGPGRLWFDALALEIVGDDVPVSGHETDRVVGEWTVSGLGTGTGRARLEGAELHITLPSYAEPPLSVVRRIALEPKVGGTATVTIDVQTRELNMKPTCSVRTLRARYASESLETASKALPPTSDGFVKCELSLEIGPTARWVELGLGGLHGRGEIALREGTVEMKR